LKAILPGTIQKRISTFKEKEEIHVISKVKGSQFQSGTGYLIVALLPPFTAICLDSSFVKVEGSTDNLMELHEHPFPLYKGLYKGKTKDEGGFLLTPNTEVYVLSTIESFIFKKDKGYVVALRREIDSFPYNGEEIVYAPFVVDKEDMLFELETMIPCIKEELNTF
jgi:hypothetical protein